jgi:hypothetical protein
VLLPEVKAQGGAVLHKCDEAAGIVRDVQYALSQPPASLYSCPAHPLYGHCPNVLVLEEAARLPPGAASTQLPRPRCSCYVAMQPA